MSTPNHPTGRGRSTAGSSSQRNAQLPAFCRSRSSRTQLVSVSNLRTLQRLMLLVLLFQISTLLLMLSLLPDWSHSLLDSSDPHRLQQQRVLP
ncbi:MAG: hypothetical protein ACKO8I_09560 [Cyanobacteriota bacterium]